MTSRGRRDRGRGSHRRVSLRRGGMLRRKRRPGSRDGGYLRSERRPGPDGGAGSPEDGVPEDGVPEGSGGAGEATGGGPADGPVVRIHRRDGRSSAPAARVTTLAALLLLVLALISLL